MNQSEIISVSLGLHFWVNWQKVVFISCHSDKVKYLNGHIFLSHRHWRELYLAAGQTSPLVFWQSCSDCPAWHWPHRANLSTETSPAHTKSAPDNHNTIWWTLSLTGVRSKQRGLDLSEGLARRCPWLHRGDYPRRRNCPSSSRSLWVKQHDPKS